MAVASVAAVTAAAGAASQAAGVGKITLNVDGRWVRADTVVELALDSPLAATSGHLAVLIGDVDWTGLCDPTPRGLRCRPAGIPFPAGESALVVYLVSPASLWQELSKFQLRILNGGGFEQASATPTVDVANKGQVATGAFPAAAPSARDRYQDATLTLGLAAKLVRGGWTTGTQANVVAVSNRPEALRFGERQDRAPFADLASYLVTTENRVAALSLGHVTFGSHRHLQNGFSSRGVQAVFKMGSRVDLAVSAVNGTAIVGWSNVFGLQEARHRVAGAMAGFELLPRAGGLRVEASFLNASLLPRSDFNQGSVTDAETNRGFGLRVVAGDARQRLKIEGGLARTRFVNPADPLLAQGAALVPVRPESRLARYLDVSYAFMQDKTIGKSSKATLTAAYRHEMVEPLYGSLMSFVRPDVLQSVVELTGNVGPVALQASGTWAHDNLDSIPSILKTLSRITQINIAVPLGSFAGGKSAAWLPAVTYTLGRTHQFGASLPLNSDFQDSHVPDQMSTNQLVGVEFQQTGWHAGYRYNHSLQDNRQVDRALADLANLTNNISVGLTPSSRADLSFDLAFEGAENRELVRIDATRRVGVNGNWRPTTRTTVAGSVSVTFMHNDVDAGENRATDFNVQFSQTIPFSKRASGKPQAQVFVRFARQSASTINPLVLLADTRRFWTLNTGVTFSLF